MIHQSGTHVVVAKLAEFLFVVFRLLLQFSHFGFQTLSLFNEIDAPILMVIHRPIHEESQQIGFGIISSEQNK